MKEKKEKQEKAEKADKVLKKRNPVKEPQMMMVPAGPVEAIVPMMVVGDEIFASSSTNVDVPSASSNDGIPNAGFNIGIPSASSSVGIPSASSSAGIPNASAIVDIPSASSSGGIPSASAIVGIPSASSSHNITENTGANLILPTHSLIAASASGAGVILPMPMPMPLPMPMPFPVASSGSSSASVSASSGSASVSASSGSGSASASASGDANIKAANRLNFHEKASFVGRKNDGQGGRDGNPLSDDNVRWDTNYQALVEYCAEQKKLPPRKFVTTDEAKLKLGMWVDTQKVRYKSLRTGRVLTDEQQAKLLALQEFKEWAENPLSDDDVRWEAYFKAVTDYCADHTDLPPRKFTTPNPPYLKLGSWLSRQKSRFKNVPQYPTLNEDQRKKLGDLKPFSDWMNKRSTSDKIKETKTTKLWEQAASGGVAASGKGGISDIRWEANYDALIAYTTEHAELPPQSFVTSCDLELKLGKWLKNQKERYKEQRVALSLEQSKKMLAVKVFKDWTDTLQAGPTDKRKDRYQKSGNANGPPPVVGSMAPLSVGPTNMVPQY